MSSAEPHGHAARTKPRWRVVANAASKMMLRTRLLVLTVGILLPLSGVLFLAERHALRRSAGNALTAHVEARLAGDGAERCGADPERFSRDHGPPPDDEDDGPGGPPPGGPGDEEHVPPRGRRGDRDAHGPPGHHPPPPDRGPNARPPFDDHEPPPGHISVYVYNAEGVTTAPHAPPFATELRPQLRAPGDTHVRAYTAGRHGGRELWMRVAGGGASCTYLLARRTEPGFRLDWLAPWVPPLAALGLAIVVGFIPVVRRIRRLASAVRRTALAGYGEGAELGDFGEDEIGELAHAFGDAARIVQTQLSSQAAREQALRDFLANTTHDVMTPLTALHGHLAALREAAQDGERVSPEVVGAAIDEAHYMASLMHNLAVAARLEAGAPHLVMGLVDLGRLVERVAARHRIVARQHGVSLDCGAPDRPCFAAGDETLLEQAVSNLVYNALRYNHAGGHVAVLVEHVLPPATTRSGRSSSEHTPGERFLLRVLDDGPGIDPSRLADLTARRVRGEDARTRHPDGQGLGLSIATQVATAHGFTLAFERPEEGGLSANLEGPTVPAP